MTGNALLPQSLQSIPETCSSRTLLLGSTRHQLTAPSRISTTPSQGSEFTKLPLMKLLLIIIATPKTLSSLALSWEDLLRRYLCARDFPHVPNSWVIIFLCIPIHSAGLECGLCQIIWIAGFQSHWTLTDSRTCILTLLPLHGLHLTETLIFSASVTEPIFKTHGI